MHAFFRALRGHALDKSDKDFRILRIGQKVANCLLHGQVPSRGVDVFIDFVAQAKRPFFTPSQFGFNPGAAVTGTQGK